jgi:hypothetical protein
VESHPIRVVVEDDLERSRLTVFFRLLLAIPHFIWLVLWSLAAVVAAVGNWFLTLTRGRSPQALHGFLAAYVRYATHVYAYVHLAANPFPGFTGEPGSYPVDVEIDPPVRQSRWKTLFRILLAVPALVLAGVLGAGGGGGGGGGGRGGSGDEGSSGADLAASALGVIGGVAGFVAFLAWFACLVRGRMPSGFRDLLTWTFRYGAQTYGYVFLLTDRYPDSDPFQPGGVGPERPPAVRLVLADDLRRSRLTVFFRLLLALPHLVWATLWSYAALLAAFVNWFVTLVAGRPLLVVHRFLAAFVRYQAHVYGYLTVAANPFPGFTGKPGYPLDLEVDPPDTQNRLVTLFRLVLAVPAFLVAFALVVALLVASFLGWFAALALGRMPNGLHNLCAYVIHYWAQLYGYLYLLSDRYPYSGPPASTEPEPEPAEPEVAPA